MGREPPPAGDALADSFARDILDHVAHPIFVKDREFRFVLVNRALCDMVRIPREELLGKTDYDFFPREQADFFRQKDIETFAGATVVIDEEPITDARGALHVLATTKVPLRDRQGAITHLVGIIHDISQLKRAEEELRRTNQELSEARRRLEDHAHGLQDLLEQKVRRLRETDRLKDEFLSVAGHELRTPLGSLSLLTGLLRTHLRDDPRAGLLLPLVERQRHLIQRMNHLITDILDVTRIQQGKLLVSPQPVALLPLVRDAVERTGDTVGARHAVAVRAAPELEGLVVRADPARLEQVLGNLLANACKYAPPDSAVTVAVERRPGGAEVRVSDEGPGIDPALHERIFDRFYQVEAAAGRSFGGLGLGLYICRELVRAQGGEIRVESAPGEGSTFCFTIPLDGEERGG